MGSFLSQSPHLIFVYSKLLKTKSLIWTIPVWGFNTTSELAPEKQIKHILIWVCFDSWVKHKILVMNVIIWIYLYEYNVCRITPETWKKINQSKFLVCFIKDASFDAARWNGCSSSKTMNQTCLISRNFSAWMIKWLLLIVFNKGMSLR